MEIRPSDHIANLITAFANLARNLAEEDISVKKLSLHDDYFGGWDLTVFREDKVLRFNHEGKDQILRISIATDPLSKTWQNIDSKTMNWKESIPFSEAFAKSYFDSPKQDS